MWISSQRQGSVLRSFVVAMSDKPFADRILNWDDDDDAHRADDQGIAHGGRGRIERDEPLPGIDRPELPHGRSRLRPAFPAHLGRMQTALQKRRFTCPLVWNHNDLGRMNFWIVVNPANFDSLHDLLRVDADRRRHAQEARRPTGANHDALRRYTA